MHTAYNRQLREAFVLWLEKHGLKMKFIAEQLGIEYTTFSKWKNDKLDFGIDKLKAIHNYMKEF